MKFLIFRIVLVFFFSVSFMSYGQINRKNVNDTPYNVILNHSYYLKETSYNPTKAAYSLPRFVENREDTAIKLKKVLDGKGIDVSFLRSPKTANYIDTLSGREIYYLYPLEKRIYVEKEKGKWYYSKETIEQLPQLYKDIYILDINPKKYFHAKFWYKEFFGISILKWLGLLLLLPICYIAYLVSKSMYYYFTNRYFKKKFNLETNVQFELKKSSKLCGLFIAARVFNELLPQLQLPVTWNAFLLRMVGVIAIVLVILLVTKIVDVVMVYFKERTIDNSNNQLLPVINRILKTSIWIIGVIYIMQYLGINVITILTGLSIGGLAVALAAQDTVKNLIGSIMIFIDKPFQINDWIQFNDIEGIVEEIGVRSTRIRTFEDSLISVPNSILADNVVNNIGLRKSRRFKTDFNLTREVSVEKLNNFIDQLVEIIKNHPQTLNDKIQVTLHDMKDGLPSIMLFCYFNVFSGNEELKCRHEIIAQMLSLAENENIEFAYPTQSVSVKKALEK